VLPLPVTLTLALYLQAGLWAYQKLKVKFERLLELDLSVSDIFYTALSHSWTESFALNEYHSNLLIGLMKQDMKMTINFLPLA
jgi:hypothetical protein